MKRAGRLANFELTENFTEFFSSSKFLASIAKFLTICSGICLFLFMRVIDPADAGDPHNRWLNFWGASHCQVVFWQRFLHVTKLLVCQLPSRSRVRPSPSGISLGCQAGLWSKHSSSLAVGFLSWLNQCRSGPSSGIHCLMACQITRSGKLSGFQLFKRVRLPDLLPWEEGFGECGFKFVDV